MRSPLSLCPVAMHDTDTNTHRTTARKGCEILKDNTVKFKSSQKCFIVAIGID